VRQPTVGGSTLTRLRAGASVDASVDALMGDLATLESPLALVLDDYHLLDAPEIHASLASLVRQCPTPFHLIISTRSGSSVAAGEAQVQRPAARATSD
jgi:LuxR family maltose regulon positive regulatory protein